jgi:hypothetical protein
MDRRTLLVGSIGLLAAPLVAEAQQAGKVARLGYLFLGAAGAESNTVEGSGRACAISGTARARPSTSSTATPTVRSDCQNWQRSSLASRWT